MPVNTRFSWPKERPALPDAYVRQYAAEYEANREGRNATSAMAQRLEGWMHRQIAARARNGQSILELGAGTLNHLAYEQAFQPARYDIVEPFRILFENSPRRSMIGQSFDRLAQIEGRVYDRIISIAVLEHMDDLPREVARAKALLVAGGLFQAGIPCEGGLAWGLAWRLSTGVAFRIRTGLDYAVVMRHEHLNDFQEILSVLRAAFDHVHVRFFPLPSRHLAFYATIDCHDDVPGQPAR